MGLIVVRASLAAGRMSLINENTIGYPEKLLTLTYRLTVNTIY